MKDSWGKMERIIAEDPRLSLEAKGMYSIITVFCGSNEFCFHGIDKFMTASGKSKPTVFRLFAELKITGYISRYKRNGKIYTHKNINNDNDKSYEIS